MSNYILPPEWTEQSGVQLTWPHQNTDWNYMLDEVTECYINVAREIAKREKLIIVTPEPERVKAVIEGKVNMENVTIVECNSNDTWARDHGGITVIDTENWITEKDENGNNRLITYRLYIETEGSDIESVNFVINQDSENPIVAELDESEITEYSGGLFSVPNNNLSNENETDRKYIDLVLDTSKWTLEQKEA